MLVTHIVLPLSSVRRPSEQARNCSLLLPNSRAQEPTMASSGCSSNLATIFSIAVGTSLSSASSGRMSGASELSMARLRAAQGPAFLLADDAQPGLAGQQPRGDLGGVVRAAVVDDDALEVAIGLRGDAGDRLREQVRLAVAGNDDEDAGHL